MQFIIQEGVVGLYYTTA